MNVEFHPAARTDLDQSAVWYDLHRPGLGDEFLAEVEATITRILEHPERWREIEVGVRGCRVNRFPFVVIYRVRQQMIQIVALSHHSRLPGYWKGRLGE